MEFYLHAMMSLQTVFNALPETVSLHVNKSNNNKKYTYFALFNRAIHLMYIDIVKVNTEII